MDLLGGLGDDDHELRGQPSPLPTMAVYGLACIFLYPVPALVFLLPTSLVSVELASGWEGGVYNWVSLGISGVWISARGTKGVAGGGLIIGTLVPGILLVVLGALFLGQGNASAAPMTTGNLLPAWAGPPSLVLNVRTYCPAQLAAYREFIEGLMAADVAGG
jgi:hypothetical protein